MSDMTGTDARPDTQPDARPDAQPRARQGARGWNYQPDVPLRVSPLFVWPPDPSGIIKWVAGAWLPVSERLIIVGIALVSWFWLQPPLEDCREFSADWIVPMFARNLALMASVAGGLHVYFHVWKRQAGEGQYDSRPLARNNRAFMFNDQVLDNMFWTCASGVTVWTAYEVLMFWALANGYAPMLDWDRHPVWFVGMFLLIPVWESFYFYWIHRLIHYPFLYRHVHALHHRNITVSPWSGLSMHPVEHIIYLGTVLIHWIVAAHPVHILYHLQYVTLTAATTHTGYCGVMKNGDVRLALGTFHHQMHHRYFECNYGGLEIPLDMWFGSFHDGTQASHERFRQRRQKVAGPIGKDF